MQQKLISCQPNAIAFGDVQIGETITHHLTFTNETANSVYFKLKIESATNTFVVYIERAHDSILKPFEDRRITVRFSPVERGWHQQNLDLFINNTYNKQRISLTGKGIPARRNSFRHVILPHREIEKADPHYLLAISNESYLQMLEAQLGEPLEWYTAVPSGTRGGRVQTEADCGPGEIFCSRDVTQMRNCSAFFGLDAQQIYYEWPTDIKRQITEPTFLSNLNEAIGHSIDNRCRYNKTSCHNILRIGGLGTFFREAPEEGYIFEIIEDNISTISIVISPRLISARYHKCFKKKAALVVRAIKAPPNYETSPYGVRTEPLEDLGSLWIACHTVTICSLQHRPEEYQVHFKSQLSPKDLKAVRERVLLYLGIEE